jgi:hypothetical protein
LKLDQNLVGDERQRRVLRLHDARASGEQGKSDEWQDEASLLCSRQDKDVARRNSVFVSVEFC